MAFRDLELRHLHALIAVANEGTFARAASSLGYTQSAMSQQIAALERTVGCPMFDRLGGARGVALTPAGQLLVEHAHQVLADLDDAELALDQLLSGVEGTLVVGTFQSVSVKVLPETLGRLRKERPALDIRLVETDEQRELLDGLREGNLDLTFAVLPINDPALDFVELCEDPFVVLCPRHERTTQKPVHRADAPPLIADADLDSSPLIGQPDGSCQLLVDDRLHQRGITTNYVFRSSDNGAVQAMVRAGMGRAIMPYLAIDPNDPGIVVANLDPPLPPRRIGIATRLGTTPPPGASRLIAIAAEVVASLASNPSWGIPARKVD